MADMHCSERTCEVCGLKYEPTKNKDGSVRRTKYHICSHLCAKRRNSDPRLVRGVRQCVRCAREFSARPGQKHCSPQCRWGAKQTIEQIRAASPNWRYCASCFKHYYGRISGSNAKAGIDRKFCSMACRVAMREKVRLEVEGLRRIAERPAKIERMRRLNELRVIRDRRDAERADQKAAMIAHKSSRPCCVCGGPVGYTLGGKRKYCSRACSRSVVTEAKRETRRKIKARRRAAKKGAGHVESVSPRKVFELAGWRCQICGIKTPEKYRGTYRPDAPELDHIVPLSKGGAHAYSNVQCACRACNGWKSDKVVVGQRVLFA